MEQLSVYSGSCGRIFYTVFPGNPTLQRAAEQQEGGEGKFSLVPWSGEKMNEGRRGKVHDGVITRSSTDAQCLSSPVCHHVDLFSKCSREDYEACRS